MVDQQFRCKNLVELVTAYLEDALSAEDRTRFEAHLGLCGGCRNYLEQFKQTIKLTGKLSEEVLEDGQKQALLNAFRDWNKDR